MCPIEKVLVWVNLLNLTSRSEADEAITRDKVLPEMGIKPGTPGLRLSKPFLHTGKL